MLGLRPLPLTSLVNCPSSLQAATASCMYCPIQQGSEYLAQRNLYRHIYGWVRLWLSRLCLALLLNLFSYRQRDICLTLLFCISSYACVFVLMKLRSRSALKAVSLSLDISGLVYC